MDAVSSHAVKRCLLLKRKTMTNLHSILKTRDIILPKNFHIAKAIVCTSMDCSLPDSSVHWILQARILEWVAISISKGSFWHRTRTQVSYIAGRFFTVWAMREAHYKELVTFYFMTTVIVCGDFGNQENKICHSSTFSSSICHKVMVLDVINFFLYWILSQHFHSHQEAL